MNSATLEDKLVTFAQECPEISAIIPYSQTDTAPANHGMTLIFNGQPYEILIIPK